MRQRLAIVVLGLGLGLGLGLAASTPIDLGWSEGQRPVSVGTDDPDLLDPAECGACHRSEYRDWHDSRHHVAHTNDIYQAGLAAEPKAFCVHCHAPLPAQTAEVLPNLPWYASQDPRHGFAAGTERAPEPLAEQGVSCAACHVRDGGIIAAEVSGTAPHWSTAVPEVGESSFCAGCHEFRMPAWENGELHLTDTPMQSTWSEWKAWRDDGGKARCQDCHMPGGSHVFRGAHDQEWLRESVEVRAKRRGDTARFVVRTIDVGHDLPSGDLFRNMTLELGTSDAWHTIATFGRSFAVNVDPMTGHVAKELTANSSLRPREKRRVEAPLDGATEWRLRYHYGSEVDENLGLLAPESIVITLHAGTF